MFIMLLYVLSLNCSGLVVSTSQVICSHGTSSELMSLSPQDNLKSVLHVTCIKLCCHPLVLHISVLTAVTRCSLFVLKMSLNTS